MCPYRQSQPAEEAVRVGASGIKMFNGCSTILMSPSWVRFLHVTKLQVMAHVDEKLSDASKHSIMIKVNETFGQVPSDTKGHQVENAQGGHRIQKRFGAFEDV